MKEPNAEKLNKLIDALGNSGVCLGGRVLIKALVEEITGVELSAAKPAVTFKVGDRFRNITTRKEYIVTVAPNDGQQRAMAINLLTGKWKHSPVAVGDYAALTATEVAAIFGVFARGVGGFTNRYQQLHT